MTDNLYVGGALGPTIFTNDSGIVQANASGVVSVNPGDVPSLLAAGAVFTNPKAKQYSVSAPATAAPHGIVASATLTSGSRTVAAQPDFMRQVQAVVLSNSPGITAGSQTWTYLANDQTVQVDVFPLETAFNTNLTLKSSKGVLTMQSVVTDTLFAGGGTPTFIMGTNAVLAVPLDPESSDFALTYLTEAGSQTPGVGSGYGLVTPPDAPNASLVYTMGYTYLAP